MLTYSALVGRNDMKGTIPENLHLATKLASLLLQRYAGRLYLLISWGDALTCCRNDLSGTIDSLPSKMQSLNLNDNSRFELNQKLDNYI